MKKIDIKSIIIGALLTSTIFLGVAATSKADAGKWDDKQLWEVKSDSALGKKTVGWEPFAYSTQLQTPIYRKRIK